mmetsp:Transcript_106780/g.312134  ORF Transcript_106780/g.312134 Transcript_106780/m.312134 type:complete len:267 (-) Transcript_106780:675-1475(-)
MPLQPVEVEAVDDRPAFFRWDAVGPPVHLQVARLHSGLHHLEELPLLRAHLGGRIWSLAGVPEGPSGVGAGEGGAALGAGRLAGLGLHVLDSLLGADPEVGGKVLVLDPQPLPLQQLAAPSLVLLVLPTGHLQDLDRRHQTLDGAPHTGPLAKLPEQALHELDGTLASDYVSIQEQHLHQSLGCRPPPPHLRSCGHGPDLVQPRPLYGGLPPVRALLGLLLDHHDAAELAHELLHLARVVAVDAGAVVGDAGELAGERAGHFGLSA